MTAIWTLNHPPPLTTNILLCTDTEEEILLETKRVLQSYPAHLLSKGHQSNTERETSAKDADQRGLIILPYAKGFQKELRKFF